MGRALQRGRAARASARPCSASILLRHGFQRVSNVLGGMTAWKRLDLPVREGPPLSREAVATQSQGTAEQEPLTPPPP